MLNLLINFGLKNRLLILCLTLTLIFGGFWASQRIAVDAFPDTTPVQVQINTVAPSLNPEEIEQQITRPVELSISGLPGLQSVRSISKFGLSQIVAVFDDETSITDARQYLSERIATVKLPSGIESPKMGPIATGLGEIFHYTIRSKSGKHTLEQLRTLHDWIIKPELRKVPGVAEVNSWGGHEKQFHVVVSPRKLLEHSITLQQVVDALKNNNRNVGGGRITISGQDLLVHGIGRVASIKDIENIVVTSVNGVPIKIKDIADEVKIGHELRRGAVTADGKGEVVLGLAFMLMGENAQKVTQELKLALEEVKKSLPADVEVNVVYDRTELTDEVLKTVKHNLIAGAILVVLTLFILLGNLRAGLLVALVIPLAMLFALLGMHYYGIAASLLSLGAIDFGLVVDGSVVMTESNMRRLSQRTLGLGRVLTPQERLQSILLSSREVARPILFGMGIIIVVFLPVLTLEGTEGKMFQPMAFTFILALVGALILALLLSPLLGYFALPKKYKKEEGWFSRVLSASYRRILNVVFRFRALTLIVSIILLVIGGFLSLKLGGEFIPKLNEGAITANTIRLAGVSIDTSTANNTRIEQHLKATFPDEIRHVWSRVGTAEVATDPMGTELTDIFITLKPREQWTHASNQNELVLKMQEAVKGFPGVNILFTQPIEMRLNEMESGIRSDVGILIYGDDFDTLIDLSEQIQKVLTGIDGQSDISGDQITGQPTLEIRIKPERLSQLGIDASEILPYIEAIGVLRVGDVYQGQRNFPLAITLPKSSTKTPEDIRSILIPLKNHNRIQLGDVAEVTETTGASTINREWGRRLIRVQCNVSGRDVLSFVNEAKQKIAENITLPEGYVIGWGGQFKNLQRAKQRLSMVVPLTLVLVFFLLYFSLKSIKDVLIIYVGIPFAMVGGVAALYWRGIPFSVSAAIGFIALLGIAVLNGQILIEAIRNLLQEGKDTASAAKDAALQRLRPVLATAITDAVGFLPMAVSTGVGAEVQKPLATVVIGGVITSTVLTLIVLPILYTLLNRKKPLVTGSPRHGLAADES